MTLIRIDGGQYLAALLALSPVLWKAFVYSKTVTSQTRWSRKVLSSKSILKYYIINTFSCIKYLFTLGTVERPILVFFVSMFMTLIGIGGGQHLAALLALF